MNDKYPKSLYDSVVEAYMQGFARRNGLERGDIFKVGPIEYSMYCIGAWNCFASLDDIRLDVDGLNITNSNRHDTEPGDLLAWQQNIGGTSPKMKYIHWLKKKYLR